MSVAKVIEITADSPTSFEDAIRQGIERAGERVKGIQSAWVQDQEVRLDNGKITSYRVKLKITFVLSK